MNANRTTTLLTNIEKLSNHELLLEQVKIARVGKTSRKNCRVVLRLKKTCETSHKLDTSLFFMWVIQLDIVDWVYSKTQILLATLKTLNQLRVTLYVSSEVEHLFPEVGCARSKHQYLTVRQNRKLFRWMLVCVWADSLLLIHGVW